MYHIFYPKFRLDTADHKLHTTIKYTAWTCQTIETVLIKLTAWEYRSADWYPAGWKVIVAGELREKWRANTRPITEIDSGLVSEPCAPPAIRSSRHDHSVTHRQEGEVEPGVVAFRVNHINKDFVLRGRRRLVELLSNEREVDGFLDPRQTVASHDELYTTPMSLLLIHKTRHGLLEVGPLWNCVAIPTYITAPCVTSTHVNPHTAVRLPFPCVWQDLIQIIVYSR